MKAEQGESPPRTCQHVVCKHVHAWGSRLFPRVFVTLCNAQPSHDKQPESRFSKLRKQLFSTRSSPKYPSQIFEQRTSKSNSQSSWGQWSNTNRLRRSTIRIQFQPRSAGGSARSATSWPRAHVFKQHQWTHSPRAPHRASPPSFTGREIPSTCGVHCNRPFDHRL